MINISVIIPTYNRSHYLVNALESLNKQNYLDFEVIVIDNGSTDDTKKICDRFKKKFKNFEYFYDEQPGLHIGRNRGMLEAKSDILSFIDDDSEVFPDWLNGIWESFSDSNVALVGGNNYPKYESISPSWLDYKWENTKNDWGNYLGELSILDFGEGIKKISPFFVWGCNFSIRKQVLLDAGGFHPDGMPLGLIKYRGDGETSVSEFILKNNLTTIFNSKASIYHCVSENRMSKEYFRKRHYIQGISDSYTTYRKNQCFKSKQKSRRSFFQYNKDFIVLLKRICFEKNYFFNNSLKKSYDQGFQFHVNHLIEDDTLKAWVIKEKYY